MKRFVRCALTVSVLLMAAPLLADDVSKADRLICAPVSVYECRPDGDCSAGPPWDYDFGPFVEIDLKKKRVSSTHSDRSTPLKTLERDGELIIGQTYETGRAFSVVISATSGFFTATVALDDGGLTIFGHCKPHGAED